MASGVVWDAIRDHLVANWTATPIAFENDNTLSDGSSVPPDPQSVPAWISVEITGTVYGQQSIGAALQADNRWDEEGILFVDVLVQSGAGSSQARAYAKQVADLFRGLTLLSGSLEFQDAYIGRGQRAEREGNWFFFPCDIEWRRIEA